MSLIETDNISPNNNPIKSKRIDESIAMKTSPIAREECANRPNNESPANLVFFCKTKRKKAIIPDITKTDKDKSILSIKPIVTPSNPE